MRGLRKGNTAGPGKLHRRGPGQCVASISILILVIGWAGEDSNLRPTDYESAALTN